MRQLSPAKKTHPRDATRKFFRIRAQWYQKFNLHLVGNSTWTTSQAQRSTLAKYAQSIRTIHYGLNVEQFKPVNKNVAREALGIADDKFVIGFACSDFTERRKGAHLLIEALKAFPSKQITLAVFGSGHWPQNATNVETLAMGSIGSRVCNLCIILRWTCLPCRPALRRLALWLWRPWPARRRWWHTRRVVGGCDSGRPDRDDGNRNRQRAGTGSDVGLDVETSSRTLRWEKPPASV